MTTNSKQASTVIARNGASPRGEEEDHGLRDDRLPVQPGTVIAGKFRIERILGQGGMGVVASAVHLQLGERVALKFLRPEAAQQPDLVARFAREARAAAKIKSEHVARVIDVGALDDDSPYIVMEYLEGSDFARVLRDLGVFPIEDAVEYIMQVCEALADAHSHGIVHRDIKPDNLFLTRRVEGWSLVKVLDFGISKAALTGEPFEDGLNLTQTLSLIGSPLYMSPEQIRRSRNVDHRTDIWSLGIVLHELLTGKSAFTAQSITQLCALILEEPTPSLRASRPEAPVGLDAVIQRCLEKDPDRRFQNVAELAIALLPYGPKRARLSAERVSTVVRASGTKLELRVPQSLPPPPLRDEIAPIHPTHHTWADDRKRSLTPPRKRGPLVLAAVAGAVLTLGLGALALKAISQKPAPAVEATSSAKEASDAAAPPPAETPSPNVLPSPVASASQSVPALPTPAVASAANSGTQTRGAAPIKRTTKAAGTASEPDLGF